MLNVGERQTGRGSARVRRLVFSPVVRKDFRWSKGIESVHDIPNERGRRLGFVLRGFFRLIESGLGRAWECATLVGFSILRVGFRNNRSGAWCF